MAAPAKAPATVNLWTTALTAAATAIKRYTNKILYAITWQASKTLAHKFPALFNIFLNHGIQVLFQHIF